MSHKSIACLAVLMSCAHSALAQPPAVPLEVRLVLKKDTQTLDLGGKTPEQFRADLEEKKKTALATKKADVLPPASSVEFAIEMQNTGKEELTLSVPAVTLELKGPGAVNIDLPEMAFSSYPSIKLAPGKTETWTFQSLASRSQLGDFRRSYWTQAGEYTLVARLTATKPKSAKPGGIVLPGGEAITVTSQPAKLKVIEPPKSCHADVRGDTEPDLKAVQGSWQLTELVSDAGPLPADRIKGVKFTIKDNKFTMDGLDGKREFTIKLDPSRKPKAIDLTALDGPFKGKTTVAIYSVAGDALKLCMGNKDVKTRPTEFKPGGEGDLMVFSLKRVK